MSGTCVYDAFIQWFQRPLAGTPQFHRLELWLPHGGESGGASEWASLSRPVAYITG